MRISHPLRWTAACAGAAAVLACGTFALVRPAVERTARARLEVEALRLGLSATVGSVRLTPRLTLELRDVVFENDAVVRIQVSEIVVAPVLSARALVRRTARIDLAGMAAELPAGVRIELERSAWLVERRPQELQVRQMAGQGELTAEIGRSSGALHARIQATDVPLSRLLHVLVHGCVVADLGTVDGDGRVQEEGGGLRVTLRGRARGVAIASLAGDGEERCRDAGLGAPTDVELAADATLDLATGSLRAEPFRVVAGGAEASGRLALDGGLTDPRIDFSVEMPRLDLGRLLATAGLGLRGDDLGSASIAAQVAGRLLDPASLEVRQRLEFTPPARALPEIERLKGPFVHGVETADGRTVEIRVSPDSPDFVALADVPPLFVRALLLGEDAGFFGHHGIDLAELPIALATNLARGSVVRGGSTISQQLAKNLFLSRRKTLSRKIEEASLALLLDSMLGKERVLEIYLNVIEWGPGIYGLRSAARHYFGRGPAELAAKQMAFLVSLIPGPIKYQRSFVDGGPTPFFEGLMAALLAKLHGAGALTDAEYAQALGAPLDLRIDEDLQAPDAP